MKARLRLSGLLVSAMLCAASLGVVSGSASAASAKPIASAAAATLAASSCNGPTVKLGMIGAINTPEEDVTPAVESAEAAAAAVTRSCELGGPVKIISCNDQFNPNVAAQCGRTLVSDGVVAIVGSQGVNGDSYTPITSAAGIPEVGSLAASSLQITNSLSYPMVNAVAALISEASVAKSLGATKLAVVGPDVSSVQQIVTILQSNLKAEGLTYAGGVFVPADVTDLTQYAAQVVATGANAILPIFTTADNISFMKDLAQQGTSLATTRVIINGATVSLHDIKQMGSAGNGLYLVSQVWPTDKTSNSGIKQYVSELKAAGLHSVDEDDMAVIAWSDVHIVANLLKNSKTKTAAALVAQIKTAGPISLPQLAPFNWSQDPFTGNPVLSAVRAFSEYGLVDHMVKGEEVPITNGFVNLFSTFKTKG